MHDSMQYNLIQDQGQGHKPFKVGNPAVFKSCLQRNSPGGSTQRASRVTSC